MLVQLDDLEQPFPIATGPLREELAAILGATSNPPDPEDPLAADRDAALRRLQAYRRLCGLPFADMRLVAVWNNKCDAAATVCRALGRLDHTPPHPDGIDDETFALGAEGARRSNLAINSSLTRSVDAYMNDSDPSNIDRIGHRRWCLNPRMRRTGFGSDGRFHAMWSMDGSGAAPKGMTAVYYPPRGYVPIDMFGPRHAWSISLLRGKRPQRDQLAVRVHQLDQDHLPAGEPLKLDHLDVTGSGYGGSACVIFRPERISMQPGRRYLIDVSFDAGKTSAHHYVVQFCAPVEDRK